MKPMKMPCFANTPSLQTEDPLANFSYQPRLALETTPAVSVSGDTSINAGDRSDRVTSTAGMGMMLTGDSMKLGNLFDGEVSMPGMIGGPDGISSPEMPGSSSIVGEEPSEEGLMMSSVLKKRKMKVTQLNVLPCLHHTPFFPINIWPCSAALFQPQFSPFR